MQYVSTRGQAPKLGFRDTALAGLARDGGLYVPQSWPKLDGATIEGFAGAPYADVAKAVLWPFVEGEIERAPFETMVEEAYATFGHPAVVPLVQSDANTFLLELFHGPTLAFKDVAMQLLARIMDHILEERGARVTVVGATSGDTGGAAIEAFRGRDTSDIFILLPHGRVSDVQRLQMTGPQDANVHALCIEGDFDDCQAIVKGMFNHHAFRDRHALMGVNSINFARVMAQIVYYFTAASALGAPQRSVSFCVPTGNFGNIFAGWAAKRMGLPIDRLVVATNENDILARTLASGRYEREPLRKTTSPSMDIQVSSNFERLLFEACGRDAERVRGWMDRLAQSGGFSVDDDVLGAIRAEFDAGAASEDEVRTTIATMHRDHGYTIDPHSAVGATVAARHVGESPMIVHACAHPAKFPDAVETATGMRPPLPARAKDLMDRKERFTVLPNDQGAVERHIAGLTRAQAGPAAA